MKFDKTENTIINKTNINKNDNIHKKDVQQIR